MKEKERENNLEKAVNALNNEQVPSGPSRELVDSTIAKLTEISGQSSDFSNPGRIRFIDRISFPNSFAKVAAAAVLLIMAGFATGRLLSPKPPDIVQLQAADLDSPGDWCMVNNFKDEYRPKALPVNSGPWSVRIALGYPRKRAA